MTAIDEHSPHHIRGRDSLNVLHQRQLNLLPATERTDGCNSVNIIMILTVIIGKSAQSISTVNVVSYTAWVCHLCFSRLSSDMQKLICHGYSSLRRSCGSSLCLLFATFADDGMRTEALCNPPPQAMQMGQHKPGLRRYLHHIQKIFQV